MLSSIIINTNLGHITDNSNYAILRTLQNTYPLIIQLGIQLNVTHITQNSARINSVSRNNPPNALNNYIYINFETNNPTLNSMNLTTYLGELQDNSPTTILNTFLRVNSFNPLLRETRIIAHTITNSYAVISTLRTHIEY